MKKLLQEDYNRLMKYFGKDVYAFQIGGHWQSEDKEYSWPTIWPEQIDIDEMAIKYLMDNHIYPNILHAHKYWSESKFYKDKDIDYYTHVNDLIDYHNHHSEYKFTPWEINSYWSSRLLNIFFDEIILILQEIGYKVERKDEELGYRRIKISWKKIDKFVNS